MEAVDDDVFARIARNDGQMYATAVDETSRTAIAHFKEMTVKDLRKYLGERRLRSEGSQAELSNLAFWAWKLKLQVNPDELTTQREGHKRMRALITLQDGTMLADPTNITDWSSDLKLLPSVQFGDLYQYLINTPGN